MRGVWKRSYGSAIEAPPDERGGPRLCPTYRHRVTSRLYRTATVSDQAAPGQHQAVSLAAQIARKQSFALVLLR